MRIMYGVFGIILSATALAMCVANGPIEPLTPVVRGLPHLSYAELTKRADVVVIATLDSEKVDRMQPAERELAERKIDVECLLTKMNIEAKLKGEVPDTSLTVKHYRHTKTKEAIAVINGPFFVKFNKDSSYILFLNTRKDGKYQCVTGFMDPVFSVRKLNDADKRLLDE